MYIVYVMIRVKINPEIAPKPKLDDVPPTAKIYFDLLVNFIPLTVLIMLVLGSILGGLATPAEAAAMGALGGLILASLYLSQSGAIVKDCFKGKNPLMYIGIFGGLALYYIFAEEPTTKATIEIPVIGGILGLWLACLRHSYQTVWVKLRESVFLTAKATAMVCWLFVGSWTFASVFSYLGGHDIIAEWFTHLDLEPWQFLVLAQLIIFFLGWPLEWSEILIIFVPIFLPLLDQFGVNPYFFAMLVALNLQTSFLTPPMAMSAYYLKGVLKNQIQLVEIFKGIIPYLGIVILSMVLMYNFPGIALWLPDYLFGVYIP